MNEVWLRLAIVVGAVGVSLLVVGLMRRRKAVSASLDQGALGPGVYLFTSSTCSDCGGARARLEDMLGGAGYTEIAWEDDPGLFTQLGIDAVPCTVLVGDDGSGLAPPGNARPGAPSLESLNRHAPTPTVSGMILSCARCGSPAAALMTFSYPDSSVWMDDLVNGVERHGYAMCADHADRMIPPLGWTLTDRRTVTRLFAPLSVA